MNQTLSKDTPFLSRERIIQMLYAKTTKTLVFPYIFLLVASSQTLKALCICEHVIRRENGIMLSLSFQCHFVIDVGRYRKLYKSVMRNLRIYLGRLMLRFSVTRVLSRKWVIWMICWCYKHQQYDGIWKLFFVLVLFILSTKIISMWIIKLMIIPTLSVSVLVEMPTSS